MNDVIVFIIFHLLLLCLVCVIINPKLHTPPSTGIGLTLLVRANEYARLTSATQHTHSRQCLDALYYPAV